MVLWTPTGNIAQTEIDLKIETERCKLAQKEKLLQKYCQSAAVLHQEVSNSITNLRMLKKGSTRAVILVEYKVVRSQYKSQLARLREILGVIDGVKNNIQQIHKQIDLLQQERARLATCILEFKKNE